MGKLVTAAFLTIDGIMESPEKWRVQWENEEFTHDMLKDLSACDALLLGRTTWQFFANLWPSRTGTLADYFNTLPKYVISATLKKTEWNNSTILSGDFMEEIIKLKAQHKYMLTWGSWQLVQSLMHHTLIDEFRIYIHPQVLGSGKRLFETGSSRQKLKLIRACQIPTGDVALSYEVEKNIL
jgi:dihydrofolate reductase